MTKTIHPDVIPELVEHLMKNHFMEVDDGHGGTDNVIMLDDTFDGEKSNPREFLTAALEAFNARGES